MEVGTASLTLRSSKVICNCRGQALIEETLRQICIRNNYSSKILIKYMNLLKTLMEKEAIETGWDEEVMTKLSWKAVLELKLNRVTLEKCINNSFKPYYEEGRLTRQHTFASGSSSR